MWNACVLTYVVPSTCLLVTTTSSLRNNEEHNLTEIYDDECIVHLPAYYTYLTVLWKASARKLISCLLSNVIIDSIYVTEWNFFNSAVNIYGN